MLAAFNGGFKIYAYGTGWYAAGRTAVSLQAGAASLVIFANGKATVTLTADKLISVEMVPTDERKNNKTGQSNGFAWRVKEGSVKDAEPAN